MGTIDGPVVAAAEVEVEQLWRDLAPDALRYATVLVGATDAHDLTVDAFVRVTRSRGWERALDPRAYLLRAITNEASNARRGAARRRARELRAAAGEPIEADPADAGVDIDLRRHIAELSVRQRAVVVLAYWHDLTESAIAETLGISAGTVHRHLERARSRLMEVMS